MTKELVQQGGQRRVAIGQPAGPLQLIQLGDEVAGDGRVQWTQSLGARRGTPITVVLRLILKVANARHGDADKKAIPTPTINKGERRRARSFK